MRRRRALGQELSLVEWALLGAMVWILGRGLLERQAERRKVGGFE